MTTAGMLEHVRRLDRHYRKRFSDHDMEHQAAEFARRLERFDTHTVRRAVDRLIDDEPHYPTPAKLYMASAACAEQTHAASPVDLDRCGQCGTAYQARTWLRSPRGAEVAAAFAPGNPHPGFVARSRDYCDCGWRRVLWYRHETELAAMGGADDPFCRDELRRRATPDRPLPRLLRVVRDVAAPMPEPVEVEI